LYILSFDIEDWFHIFDKAYYSKSTGWEQLPTSVEKDTGWLLDFLQEHKLKATFFTLGWVAEKYPLLVKKIHHQGHEVAAHSYQHTKVYQMDNRSFREDTKKVIHLLEDLTGNKVDTYRAPGFSLNKKTLWAFEILHEFGIRVDSSLKSNLHMGFPGRIPGEPFLLQCDGFQIREFPTRTFPLLGNHIIYSGSGYFRIWPYWFIRKRFRHSAYEMAYFHPRDFDNQIHQMFMGHPYLQLRYRIGTNRSQTKLKFFAKDFDFLTLRAAEKIVNWDQVKVLNLLNGSENNL
jgi:polysaccharide deacetylase family protein (PEP-CTERM system associated)